MAPEMSEKEIENANSGTVAEPRKGNGAAATMEAKLDEFLAPVATNLVNGASSSLMMFFPIQTVAHRLAFLLGRAMAAGFQAPDLVAMMRFRADLKRHFEAGLSSIPPSISVAGQAGQDLRGARPPG